MSGTRAPSNAAERATVTAARMPALQWHRDGHRITFRVSHGAGSSGGRPYSWIDARVAVACPGAGACEAPRSARNGADPSCKLQQRAECLGAHEFVERYAHRPSIPVAADLELPLEIEWGWDGWGDASEPVWRPAPAAARTLQVALGADETRLLELLMSAPRAALPRDGLADLLTGPDDGTWAQRRRRTTIALSNLRAIGCVRQDGSRVHATDEAHALWARRRAGRR